MKPEIDPGNPFLLEPLVPSRTNGETAVAALTLIENSATMSGFLPPPVEAQVVSMVRSMNGYYSNLIEGHRTKPADIARALAQSFEGETKNQEYQLLHYAHLAAQNAVEKALRDEPSLSICTSDFLCFIHREFYSRLPETLRVQQDAMGRKFHVAPGELRDHEVSVGKHVAPPAHALEAMLERFSNYEELIAHTPEGLIAGMAAHHRLAWIHPFGDGNGRVARLFTHAWFLKSKLGGVGLWTLARGLARRLDRYKETLARADQPRQGDLDGRGARSEKALIDFCDFMLETAIDQVRFMRQLLIPEQLLHRVGAYCRVEEEKKALPIGAAATYGELLRRGRLTRGEVAGAAGKSFRAAQGITRTLLEKGYCESPSPKGPLFPLFPLSGCAFFFPDLYPAGGSDMANESRVFT